MNDILAKGFGRYPQVAMAALALLRMSIAVEFSPSAMTMLLAGQMTRALIRSIEKHAPRIARLPVQRCGRFAISQS
jgi:hypothetical protein